MNLPDITEVVAMGELDKPFDGIPADSEQEFSAKIADVDIRDDFMFSYVMCNPPDLHGTSAISVARPQDQPH